MARAGPDAVDACGDERVSNVDDCECDGVTGREGVDGI